MTSRFWHVDVEIRYRPAWLKFHEISITCIVVLIGGTCIDGMVAAAVAMPQYEKLNDFMTLHIVSRGETMFAINRPQRNRRSENAAI